MNMMNKLNNQIIGWLLKFGDRDEDGFSCHTADYYVFINYTYDLEGNQFIEALCLRSGKYPIYNPTIVQLAEIFKQLNDIKQ